LVFYFLIQKKIFLFVVSTLSLVLV